MHTQAYTDTKKTKTDAKIQTDTARAEAHRRRHRHRDKHKQTQSHRRAQIHKMNTDRHTCKRTTAVAGTTTDRYTGNSGTKVLKNSPRNNHTHLVFLFLVHCGQRSKKIASNGLRHEAQLASLVTSVNLQGSQCKLSISIACVLVLL